MGDDALPRPWRLVHGEHPPCTIADESALDKMHQKTGVPLKNLKQLVGLTKGPHGKRRGEAEGWRALKDVQYLRREGGVIIPVLWVSLHDFILHVAKSRPDMLDVDYDRLSRLLNGTLTTGKKQNKRPQLECFEYQWSKY